MITSVGGWANKVFSLADHNLGKRGAYGFRKSSSLLPGLCIHCCTSLLYLEYVYMNMCNMSKRFSVKFFSSFASAAWAHSENNIANASMVVQQKIKTALKWEPEPEREDWIRAAASRCHHMKVVWFTDFMWKNSNNKQITGVVFTGYIDHSGLGKQIAVSSTQYGNIGRALLEWCTKQQQGGKVKWVNTYSEKNFLHRLYDLQYIENHHKRSINQSEFAPPLLTYLWHPIGIRAGKSIHIAVGISLHKRVVWWGDSTFDSYSHCSI